MRGASDCLEWSCRYIGVVVLTMLLMTNLSFGEDAPKTGEADDEPVSAHVQNSRQPPSTASGYAPEGLPIVGWSMGCVLAAGGLFYVLRRRRSHHLQYSGGNGLRVIERIALSPKHWMCLVRAEHKFLVVGMTPESLTTLAVIEDEAPASRTSDHVEASAPLPKLPKLTKDDSADSYWFRPREESTESRSGTSAWDHELAPYRREVTRLKAMLQQWREGASPDERSGGRDR